jgi:2-keto-4-pentenoate hydratase/2-oxohepta-3-ene-1,7-dioic acid hydratase in catechol pathway
MRLTVNGHVRQQANTGQMIYKVADIVSFLSHLMTLEPGDVICTGTPSGVAMATGQWLGPGDEIKCSIKGLGSLKNTVGAKPDKFYKPLA